MSAIFPHLTMKGCVHAESPRGFRVLQRVLWGDRDKLTFCGGREAHGITGWIGITSNEWFAFLSRERGIDEIKFWRFRD